jgi:hypothetical protein
MRKITFFIFCLMPVCLQAQKEHLKPTLIDNTDKTGWIYLNPEKAPGLRGDHYLFSQWKTARVVFKNELVKEGLLVNYNLLEDALEIATNEGVKVVPEGYVLTWEVDGRVYASLASFKDSCIPVQKDYAEILSDRHDLILLKIHGVERKNPSYNEKLGIGDDNYRMIKSEKIFLLYRGHCREINGNASKRKRLILELLDDRQVSKIIEQQDLNLKEESDLIRLLEQITQDM